MIQPIRIKAFAVFIVLLTLLQQNITAQNNTPHLVRKADTTAFKAIVPEKDGMVRTYIVVPGDISNASPDGKSRLQFDGPFLVCIEGPVKDGLREGIFTTYVIDSADHKKRYKVAEQEYKNDLLNGHWRGFDLNGTCKYDLLFAAGKRRGASVYYLANGKDIEGNRNYMADSLFVETTYYTGNKLRREITFDHSVMNGPAKLYYPNGQVEQIANFKNGNLNDTLKYYHDNGVLWSVEIMKDGKHYTVVANYDKQGKSRNAGTLANGTGTRILYNEDDTARETVTYKEGILVKQ